MTVPQLLPWLVGHVLDPGAPRWDVFTSLAVAAVPAADAASVLPPGSGGAGITFGSNVAAAEADRYQLCTGEGPALLALSTCMAVEVPDVAADDRWPRFRRHAGAVGWRSALCVPVAEHPDTGGELPSRTDTASEAGGAVLSFYSRHPAAFGGGAGEAAAEVGAVLAAALSLRAAHRTALGGDRGTAAARAVIEQAKGIVMNENRCGPDEAFAELRACAIRSGIRLQALAEKLVAGAVRPWDDAFPRP